ncbi:MAG: restriction endonuclease subunit S [Giesbergeria sp.]|nr:restriction endonuclease subunit S [Giesbergeria sp.]
MTRLRDLGRWSGGNTPSKANIEYWTNGTVPWVSPKDMKFDEITRSEDLISQSALAEGRVSLLPTGSVLVVTRSGILSHTLPVAVTKLPVTINQDIKALTLNTGVSAKYVAHALRGSSQRILRQCSKHGTTVASVDTNALLDFEIPMVGFNEQEAVVAELEKQFSRLDEAVANLQRVRANLKRYKASVLKAAVEGRLVETEATLARREGRTYETGELLLQRILEERRAKWTGKGKYKEPAKADGMGVVPEGWTNASLDMLSTDSGYGTSQKCGYENDGPVVLRIPNVQHGVLDLHDLKFAPTEFKLSQSDAVSSGDMLIIRTNGSKSLIGRAAVVMAEPQRKMSFASYLIRFRLSSVDCIPAWVSVVWQTSQMREWIEAHAATSAGQHNVSMTVLAKAAIPVPPVTEQARIVAEVDRHLSIIREVEAEVDANLQRAQALRQSTLAKAFEVRS